MPTFGRQFLIPKRVADRLLHPVTSQTPIHVTRLMQLNEARLDIICNPHKAILQRYHPIGVMAGCFKFSRAPQKINAIGLNADGQQ